MIFERFYERLPMLSELRNARAATLSDGRHKQLAIARAPARS